MVSEKQLWILLPWIRASLQPVSVIEDWKMILLANPALHQGFRTYSPRHSRFVLELPRLMTIMIHIQENNGMRLIKSI